MNSCAQKSDGEINCAFCAWAKQSGQKSVVTDGTQKWSPAQSFSDKSVKIKGNKSVGMHMFLICGNEWASADDKLQFYLAHPSKILIQGIFFVIILTCSQTHTHRDAYTYAIFLNQIAG